jgi:hypothetical protein
MRAADIIRAILDILDQQDQEERKEEIPNEPGEQNSRFKQIFAMLDNPSRGSLSNSPNEIVAPISAVTTDAGGGVNGSKHPHDIRVKDPSMYPGQQEY